MIVQPRVSSLNQSMAKNQQRLAIKRSRPDGDGDKASESSGSIAKQFFMKPTRELLDAANQNIAGFISDMHSLSSSDEAVKLQMKSLISNEAIVVTINEDKASIEVRDVLSVKKCLEEVLVTYKPSQESVRNKKEHKRKRSAENPPQPEPVLDNNFQSPRPNTRLSDLAGIDAIATQVTELILHPIAFPQLYNHLGIAPPTGILLHGPSGSGKTTLANAISGETGLTFFRVSGPELVGGTAGESEERIRQVFDNATNNAPSILFIDAIDVIAAKKDSNQRGMDRRIIAQLYDSIDQLLLLNKESFSLPNTDTDSLADPPLPLSLSSSSSFTHKMVFLLVATTRPDGLDPAVRGRFTRELSLPVPDSTARSKILSLHCQSMRLDKGVDFAELGRVTPGYVGADLVGLVREAGMVAVSRIIKDLPTAQTSQPTNVNVQPAESQLKYSEHNSKDTNISALMSLPTPDLQPLSIASDQMNISPHPLPPTSHFSTITFSITMEDFLKAMQHITPAGKREGFVMTADITWGDIGALTEVREELNTQILDPITYPERFRALGLDMPAGVLFYGPPGCGKTLLAKALANQSGANFISVKGPELLNMYVGESESRVRQVFARARASAPCMIFFDELDALVPRRSSGFGSEGGSSNGVAERVVNQLLTELDGLESRRDVYIIGATNRLELIDEAMLRPGRLGNLLYVPLPTAAERVSILKALMRKVSVDTAMDLQKIAFDSRCEGYSGADCSALVREAGLAVIKEMRGKDMIEESSGECVQIEMRHFEQALSKVRPSVSPTDRIKYENVRKYLKEGLSAIEALRKAFMEQEEE